MEATTTILTPWANFYVMAGSAAAALTGLMFVVITLVTGRERRTSDGISTFSTPTVIHFAFALLVSAVLVAPWRSPRYAVAFATIIGLCGFLYILRIALKTRRLSAYRADLEDWTWYSVIPLVAYGAIFAGGVTFIGTTNPAALFVIGGGVILLIFIGIRNAWDVVTFLAISGPPQ